MKLKNSVKILVALIVPDENVEGKRGVGMNIFRKEDLEGTGVNFEISDIKINLWLGEGGKYCCRVKSQNLVCGSISKNPEYAFKSAVSKLAIYMVEFGYIATITDKGGGKWFKKSFMGEHND